MKNVFKTLMLPALLIVAACSNDTNEMISARQSDEPTEKEMMQTQVREMAEQYGVVIGFNEERWQNNIPSVTNIQNFLQYSRDVHLNSDSCMGENYFYEEDIRTRDFLPLRYKTKREIHDIVTGEFTCQGWAHMIYYVYVNVTVRWTHSGALSQNSVKLDGYIEHGWEVLDLNNVSCSDVSFYGLDHSFRARYNNSWCNIEVEYNDATGIGVLCLPYSPPVVIEYFYSN